ncbi:MAG: hypothetical protein V5A34_09515 [Halapricum sp.]
MQEQITRRQLLAGLGATASFGLGGCLSNPLSDSGKSSGDSQSYHCETTSIENGNGNVLKLGVSGTIENGDVRLEIPIPAKKITEQNLDRLVIYDISGDIEYVIPVSARNMPSDNKKARVNEDIYYHQQYLGRQPYHGQYRAVAEDRSGEVVDSISIQFNCYSASDE